MTQLSEIEYRSTMSNKMVDITETANPTLDIWPYVEKLLPEKIVDEYTFQKRLVEIVYRNQTNTFDHVLLPTPNKNKFIVIIVDLVKQSIKGHYLLDVNTEYGLR